MSLEELKALLGIPLEDTEENKLLEIKLKGVIEVTEIWFKKNAKSEYIKYDKDGKFIIPDGAKIAISKYIEATEIVAGVRSEHIGGMSQTFAGGTASSSEVTPLDDYYAYLEIYKDDDKITFIPMRKYEG